MIALYLLAAHLVGDFVLQTRWQAAGKFTDRALRTRHVAVYCLPFVPVAVWRIGWQAFPFLLSLYVLHWLTDSRRFRSTLGDWVGWRCRPFITRISVPDPAHRPGERIQIGSGVAKILAVEPEGSGWDYLVRLELEPNPWSPMPILIDQALHVAQLALLGGLFLR